MFKFKQIFTLIILGVLIVGFFLFAGTFTPSPVSPGASSYTLSDIYNKISSSTYEYSSHDFTPPTTPASTLNTLSEIWNAITWQTLDNSGTLAAGLYEASSLETAEPNLIAANIATGTTMFGVVGTCESDPCNGVSTCSGPDDCYTNETLKSEGLACLNGQLLRWSNAPAPIGKGENYTYGHWYKDGSPDIHLVDNLSSLHVKTTHTYVDVSAGGINPTGRANNGLYYKGVTPVSCGGSPSCSLSSEFGIAEHAGDVKNADQCNYVNIHQSIDNNACANLGMRLPIIRETTGDLATTRDSCDYSGAPALSLTDGVPTATQFYSWAASADTILSSHYWEWNGSNAWSGPYSVTYYLICVLP